MTLAKAVNTPGEGAAKAPKTVGEEATTWKTVSPAEGAGAPASEELEPLKGSAAVERDSSVLNCSIL